MKTMLFPLSLSALMLAAPSFADSYQTEVSAGYSDHSTFDNADVWGLGVRQYLTPVSTDNGPFELNGFLSHASYLEAGASFNDNVDTLGLGGRFIATGDWVLGASYQNIDPDQGKSADLYRIEAGRYLNDSTLLTGYYSRLDWGNFDADTLGARVEHYLPLAGQTGLHLQGDISNTDADQGDDVFVLAASGDYFFNRQLSAGLGVTLVDSDNEALAYGLNDVSANTYSANASYWFNPRANVKMDVSKTEGVTGMGWGIKGSYRF
ncbi:putative porin [Gallaecimonas kandeliae]|uniref:putative porin n=1 Tax=Gallaecimonas kandeliae TaxID=3029055 RepID=UPI002649A10B|nr:putative porin [Gallaecimonas kandeliae]WKE66005.1 putative porin [Gallaecimonas kandeliae]